MCFKLYLFISLLLQCLTLLKLALRTRSYKSFPINVTYYDGKSTKIENLSTAWQLPTTFLSNYPDSIRLDLDGFKTGPGLDFHTSFNNGTISFNTLNRLKIKTNHAGFSFEEANITFI